MTTITRELIAAYLNGEVKTLTNSEQKELARIALASLDAGSNSHPAHGPLSNDRLHRIREILGKAAAQSDGGNIGYAMSDAVKAIDELLEGRKAEPVAWEWFYYKQWHVTNDEERVRDVAWGGVDVVPLYRHAPPATVVSDREKVRREHAAWSQATFGDVGPIGPLKHLSKEALEAAAEPGDLCEWADMQFLLWDAQRRAGISDEQINQAMVEKLAVNKQREWPEPKDGEPRLHIKEQPAAVVPDEMTPQQASRSYGGEVRGYRDGWNACRAAMLQGSQPVSNREELPVSEIECDICGFKSTDPDGAHYCCEDNSND